MLCIFVDIPANWKWKKIHSSYQCQSYEKDWLFCYISVGIDKFWNHCELSPANLWPPTLLLLCTSGIQSKASPSVSTAISLACYSEHKSPKTSFSENFQCLHFIFPLSCLLFLYYLLENCLFAEVIFLEFLCLGDQKWWQYKLEQWSPSLLLGR